MAIYHFSAKIISRATGRSAVAAAAYRAAEALHDERLDRTHDFTAKAGVVNSEILLPAGAPERLTDRVTLWNEVERGEKRKDAQLAREIEFAIPRELTKADGIALARMFVVEQFVARGMVADLNVHREIGADGEAKPHAHVMLAMREVGPDGFGAKVRDWNATALLDHWREVWADHANRWLAERDIDARIDHRSYAAQGIDLEPQGKVGPAASRRLERGQPSERADEQRAIASRNGDRIIADPAIALNAITHMQATFTPRDLAMFAHRHSDGQAQYEAVVQAVRASPDLIALGRDGRGNERFTSRDMLDTERRLEAVADRLAAQRGAGLPTTALDKAMATAGSDGLVLGSEQETALRHITAGHGLSMVVGYAGTGKSAVLGVAYDAWAAAGLTVRGMALSGIAAEKLEEGSRMPSRTIASVEMDWAKGRDLPGPRDILVMDEAGMVGTRQMARVLAAVEQGGARIVLVGDAEQLQAIEAGAAFRALTERHGAVEISAVRRQREDWQRQATRWLATGRTAQAIDAYASQGMVHAADARDEARTALIAGWDRERIAAPDKTRIILTHTNAEVRDLNEAARAMLHAGGALGDDVTVKAARGERAFATGDRIMFLRNERGLGVKNGTLGQVDGAHVLATPGLDRHAAYVALSRHRDGAQLHYGRDDFADMRRLVRTLSRERAKDMASDHLPASEPDAGRAFAEQREIWLPERFARKVVERARSIFAGVRWPDGAERARDADRFQPERVREPERGRDERLAVERFARAWSAIERTQAQGYEALPHQRQALTRAGEALDAIRIEGSVDLASAFDRAPELVRKAADGGGNEAVRAMHNEAQVRADPFLRAERFIEGWQDLQRDRDQLVREGDLRAARKAEAKMTAMARGLDHDRVMATILLGGGHDERIDVDAVRSAARTDAHTPDHAGGRDAGDRERGFDR